MILYLSFHPQVSVLYCNKTFLCLQNLVSLLGMWRLVFCVSEQVAIRNNSSNYERAGSSLSPGCRAGMCNLHVLLSAVSLRIVLIYEYVLMDQKGGEEKVYLKMRLSCDSPNLYLV